MANKSIDKHYLLETLKDFYTTILLTFFQKKLTVTTVPSDPVNGDVIIYVGATSGDFIQGHTYKYSTLPNQWTDITAVSGGGTWGSITGTLSDQTDLQAALDEKAVAVELSNTEYENLPIADKEDPSKVYFAVDKYNLETKDWDPEFAFSGNANIWSHSNDIYCSLGTTHYKLNGNTWETVTWSGGTGSLSNFNAVHIWTDGTNTYYSDGYAHYKFNGTGWDNMSWSGYTAFDATYIWTDGTDIYSSNGTDHYKLSGTTWSAVTWSGLTSFSGYYVWSDGTDIYYSEGNTQYKLNGSTWESMTWTGLTSFYGQNVWKDGENIYYSQSNLQYILDGTTWKSITWDDGIYGSNVWTDGNHIYYSSSGTQYIIIPKGGNEAIYYKNVKYSTMDGAAVWGNITGTISNQTDLQTALNGKAVAIELSQSEYNALTPVQKADDSKIYFIVDKDSLWDDFPSTFVGDNVWTDGTNTYYSSYTDQYKLNGKSWGSVTWTGISNMGIFHGDDIWTDGNNIYLSVNQYQYKLNGTTWETMTWTGRTNFSGSDIWTDGTDIYYSHGTNQYKLNGTTWETMSWSGLTNYDGCDVWTDGTDFYYSFSTSQYKLNGTTWEVITWSGYAPGRGKYIWNYGTDVYYSLNNDQYKLNGTTWGTVTWGENEPTTAENVWTDGIKLYYGGDYVFNGAEWVTYRANDGIKIYYKNIPYAEDEDIILSNTFAANAEYVNIDISSLNVATNNYTFKYFSTVEGLGYSSTSYNSSTGIFTINFNEAAPSAGTFYIQAHKVS